MDKAIQAFSDAMKSGKSLTQAYDAARATGVSSAQALDAMRAWNASPASKTIYRAAIGKGENARKKKARR